MRLVDYTRAIVAFVQMEQLMWRGQAHNLIVTQAEIGAALETMTNAAEQVGAVITAGQLRIFRREFIDVRRSGLVAIALADFRETLMDELEKINATIS